MIPDNKVSSVSIVGKFLQPERTEPLLSTSFGGEKLGISSQDFSYLWQGSCDGQSITLKNGDESIVAVSGKTGIKYFDFTFTRGMTYVVVWMDGLGSHMKYFNTLENNYTELLIPQATNISCELDDKRSVSTSQSDVIISYQKFGDDGLYIRVQRERYETETKISDKTEGKLFQTGMMNNSRFGWAFSRLINTIDDYVCSISDGFINYQSKARERYTYIFDTPEFDAVAQTILEQRMERQCEYLKLRDQMLDIDKSNGEALDLIGRLVGQQRTLINFIVDPYFGFLGARGAEAYNVGYWYTLNAASRGSVIVLSDELYRKVLRARIIKNGSNNNRQSLLGVLKALGESTPILIYKAHGVIEVQLTQENDPHGLISYFLSRVMRDDTIIPRQLGYRIGTRFISQE